MKNNNRKINMTWGEESKNGKFRVGCAKFWRHYMDISHLCTDDTHAVALRSFMIRHTGLSD